MSPGQARKISGKSADHLTALFSQIISSVENKIFLLGRMLFDVATWYMQFYDMIKILFSIAAKYFIVILCCGWIYFLPTDW